MFDYPCNCIFWRCNNSQRTTVKTLRGNSRLHLLPFWDIRCFRKKIQELEHRIRFQEGRYSICVLLGGMQPYYRNCHVYGRSTVHSRKNMALRFFGNRSFCKSLSDLVDTKSSGTLAVIASRVVAPATERRCLWKQVKLGVARH